MIQTTSRPGYVYLTTVLVIGVLAGATTLSVLSRAVNTAVVVSALKDGIQANELASSCIEYGLREIVDNQDYPGDETINVGDYECDILPIASEGLNPWHLCSTATVNNSTRKIETVYESGAFIIYSWEEVGSYTLCAE